MLNSAVFASRNKTLYAGTTLPQVTGGYVAVDGVKRFVDTYRGRMYRFYCATATPNFLDIYQDSTGKADVSGVSAWSGGSLAVYCCGKYDQLTGEFLYQQSSGRWPLVDLTNTENGFQTLSQGYDDTGVLSLNQTLSSRKFSVDRGNTSMWLIARQLGHGLAINHLSLARGETLSGAGGPANLSVSGNSNVGPMNAFGSTSNNGSMLPPIINRLSVMGVQSSPTAMKLHSNDRVYTDAVQAGANMDRLFCGKTPNVTTFSSMQDICASIATQLAPTDTQAQAIKDLCTTAFSIVKTRANVMVVTPHSLCFNGNLGVKNKTVWKQMMPLMTHALETYLMGTPGQTMLTVYNTLLSRLTTDVYDATVSRFIYYLASPVNDVNGLSSGFANGVQSSIDTAALNIYNNTYKPLFVALKAQGSNVRIVMATAWHPNASFWSGTMQDKADKTSVLDSWTTLLGTKASPDGFVISSEDTIDTTAAIGDSIHTNQLGEGRRAAIVAPVVDALCV